MACSAIPYRLDYHGRWTLAPDELDRAWTDSVRAVLAVSPNNPTGSMLSARRAAALSAIVRPASARRSSSTKCSPTIRCAAGTLQSATCSAPTCLTFRLGGLSKSAGLPQVKLGWMHVDGPEALVDEALERLEVICDAYLSVSTPVQVAAPCAHCGRRGRTSADSSSACARIIARCVSAVARYPADRSAAR